MELSITLAAVGILATVGLTTNAYFTQKNEQQRLVDDLKNAIEFSKLQAIQLGKPVTLEPIDPNQNWAQGLVLNTKEKVLYQWQWHYPLWILQWVGVRSTNKITFSNNPVNAISNGTFHLSHVGSNLGVDLVLNRLGRVRD